MKFEKLSSKKFEDFNPHKLLNANTIRGGIYVTGRYSDGSVAETAEDICAAPDGQNTWDETRTYGKGGKRMP